MMKLVHWLVWMAAVLGAAIPAPRAGAEDATRPLAVLTNAAQVHRLPPEVAAHELPVRLEGIVTHYHLRLSDGLCFQDATDGVYVSLQGLKPEVSVGDRVVIEGTTGSGDYAPIVLLLRMQRLGRGELPKPERVTRPPVIAPVDPRMNFRLSMLPPCALRFGCTRY